MKRLVIGSIIFLSVALTYQIFNIDKKTKLSPSDKIEQENQEKMKNHLKSLTSGCDMTTFQGRLNCFKNKIAENRKSNTSIPTQYFLIGKGFNLKLKAKDLGDIIQIDRPESISIKDCVAKSIYFDWNQSYFFIAPDSFDSGAICDSSKGRIAIVPSTLTNTQIQDFYKHMSKK
jgi:regulatory protein YycI of two-component signal transduction system YycFG